MYLPKPFRHIRAVPLAAVGLAAVAAVAGTMNTGTLGAADSVEARALAPPSSPSELTAPAWPFPETFVRVAVPAGMSLSNAWLVDPSGAEGPATALDGSAARFDGLAGGTYTVGYQVQTSPTTAGGATVSASTAAWAPPVSVEPAGSVLLLVEAVD